jgi:putative transcriptional regulator
MSKLFKDLKQGVNDMAAHVRGENVPGITLSRVVIKAVPTHAFGDVKRARTKLGLSQGALAAILGVTKKTVEAWEAGTNVPIKPVLRLLQLLTSRDDLLGDLIEKTKGESTTIS